ncbi:NAD(P)-binding protein, partial [Aureobasidium melanogenum]|uniref:NAD(P)-binding protein n=1 Tax=Aureobasidium melanogenum (strain CBS 110374) TaxID=1043003 RepID=A0A074VVZ3_AURM1
MATYLITGASRGIGLELTKQLLKLPASRVSKVFAVARNSEVDAIKQLVQEYPDRVCPVSASIDDDTSIQKAAEIVKTKLAGHGLDVLVNNAGIAGTTSGSIKDMDLDQLTQILNVNVIGTQRVSAAFMSLLEQGTQKKIVNMSSGLGSFAFAARTATMPTDAYIISKTALNMLTLRWANQYADAGFTIVAISPGWLKTDMGHEHADLSVEMGVAEVKRLILESGKEQNGKFLNIRVPKTEGMVFEYDGKGIAW